MALTAAQLAQLQQQLQARRSELQALIHGGLTAAGGERPAGEVYDRGDEALAGLQVDTDLAVGDIDFEELRDIDGALARLTEGGYGQCTACGAEIPLARLLSQPAASRCIHCQGEVERLSGRETHRL